MGQTENINPSFRTISLISFIGFILAGIGVSIYLTYSHYMIFTDVAYESFCAISKTVNCETVSQSKYAIFLNVPIAVWGIFGYLFLFSIFILSVDIKQKAILAPWSVFALSLFYSLISLLLGIISSVLIQAYCIMCLASWVINFALLFIAWFMLKPIRFSSFFETIKIDFRFWKHLRKKAIFNLFIFGLIGITIILFYPDYWRFNLSADDYNFQNGITEDGHPWIGAEKPELTITVFSDYQCFQCKKMNYFLKKMVSRFPDKIRIVHRHFPMDHTVNPIVTEPFHSGSGILALIAIASMEEGQFWSTHDYLFNYEIKGSIWLRKIAKDLNLDLTKLRKSINKNENRNKLASDILFGINQKITGTPAYIIGGKIYMGHLPMEIIKSLNK